MNSVGQSGDKKSYRAILLLAVGLTAFTSTMKELNQLREFTRDASNLVVSWSSAVAAAPVREVVVPAQIREIVAEVPPVVAKVEACESSHAPRAAAPVEQLQLGGAVAQAEVKIKDVGKTVVVERTTRRDPQVAMLRHNRSADIELMELRKQARRVADLKVMIMADDDREVEIAVPAGVEFKMPKVRTHRQVIVTPGELDILKSLNRSLNLRSAG